MKLFFLPPPILQSRLLNNTAWWALLIIFVIPDNGWPLYSQLPLKLSEIGIVLLLFVFLYQKHSISARINVIEVAYFLLVLSIVYNVALGYANGYLGVVGSSVMGAIKTILLFLMFYPLRAVDYRIVSEFPQLVMRLGLFHIVFSLLLYFTPWVGDIGKIQTILGNTMDKTVLGPLFIWGIVVAIMLKVSYRWLWVTVLSVGVLFSFSKTAIYALPLLIGIMFMTSPKKVFLPMALFIVLSIGFIGFGDAIMYQVFRGSDIFQNLTVFFEGERGEAHVSAKMRSFAYFETLDIVTGEVNELRAWLGRGYFYMKSVFDEIAYTTDSTFAPIALDYGLVALISFCIVYLGTCWKLLMRMMKTNEPIVKTYFYFGLTLFPFFITRNFVQYLKTSVVIMLFVTWLAFSLSVLKQNRKAGREKPYDFEREICVAMPRKIS